MTSFLARRLGAALLILLGVATATFLLIHAAPGDPADLYVDREMDPQAREAVLRSFGLDRPPAEQYLRWLAGVARGDLGWSITHRRPVLRVLGERVPATLLLTGSAFVIQMLAGVLAGLASAWRRGSLLDALASGSMLVLYAIPTFWLGTLLILTFALSLGWLPSSGTQDLLDAPATPAALMGDRLRHLVLPALCLGLGSAAAGFRYVRAGLLSAVAHPFIDAARARGAGRATILLRHALRHALPPIITLAGLSVPLLLGGSVLVESVFSWPGMGQLSVQAVFARDYPVVLAVGLLTAAAVILGSLLADLGLFAADPRLREGWRP